MLQRRARHSGVWAGAVDHNAPLCFSGQRESGEQLHPFRPCRGQSSLVLTYRSTVCVVTLVVRNLGTNNVLRVSRWLSKFDLFDVVRGCRRGCHGLGMISQVARWGRWGFINWSCNCNYSSTLKLLPFFLPCRCTFLLKCS